LLHLRACHALSRSAGELAVEWRHIESASTTCPENPLREASFAPETGLAQRKAHPAGVVTGGA
jgi:hypothetical protein